MFASKPHILCSESRPSREYAHAVPRLVQDGTRDTTPEVLAAS